MLEGLGRTQQDLLNALLHHAKPLHREWDDVPAALKPAALGPGSVAQARAIAATPGDLLTWSSQWATDTIHAARPAFANVVFSDEDEHKHWAVDLPDGYDMDRNALQRAQLLKGGARLAAVLRAIWP